MEFYSTSLVDFGRVTVAICVNALFMTRVGVCSRVVYKTITPCAFT